MKLARAAWKTVEAGARGDGPPGRADELRPARGEAVLARAKANSSAQKLVFRPGQLLTRPRGFFPALSFITFYPFAIFQIRLYRQLK